MGNWQKMYDLACVSEGDASQFVTYLGEVKELLDAVDGARAHAGSFAGAALIPHENWGEVIRAWQHSC